MYLDVLSSGVGITRSRISAAPRNRKPTPPTNVGLLPFSQERRLRSIFSSLFRVHGRRSEVRGINLGHGSVPGKALIMERCERAAPACVCGRFLRQDLLASTPLTPLLDEENISSEI